MQTWCYYPKPDEVYYHHTLDNSVISMAFGIDSALSQLDRQTIKAKYLAWDSWTSENGVSQLAAMLYHFAHTLEVGDRIVYPSTRIDRKIRVGVCTGSYRHVPEDSLDCIHQRDVEWLKTFDRGEFSPDALRGISINTALFRVRSQTFLRELDQLMG